MRKLFLIWALVFAAVGCASQPTTVTGTKVNVAGGTYLNVNPAQFKQMLTSKDFVLINVHIPYEGEIEPTDAFIPYDRIAENLSQFPADQSAKIFLYCRSGRMSAIAAEELVKRGYTNVWNLDGGMVAWEQARLPIVDKKR